ETEAQVAALEKRMADEGDSENFAVNTSTSAFAAPKLDTSKYREAFSTKYVNMRIRPKKNAQVMGVIPVDAEFKVEPVCKHWCGVEYDGRHGYIYRTFFEYIGKEEG
ncbi:MAG: SH3 domain-containing protein, partial [Pseudomonadota bacterium]